MPRTLISCWFDGDARHYGRLARVLEFSARMHCHGWDVRVVEMPSPAGVGAYVANTAKLDWWAARILEMPDVSECLLVDSDAVILRGLDDVWDREFDVAYTARPSGSRLPLNAGVVFVRATSAGKGFVAGWAAENRAMMADQERHAPWRRAFGGINQAALGRVLSGDHGARVLSLPCAEWNCEDSTWGAFDESVTRIVHVKGRLRLAALGMAPALPRLRRLVGVWRRVERESEVCA